MAAPCRLSWRKVGGIRFVRVGRLTLSFCVSRPAPRTVPLPAEVPMPSPALRLPNGRCLVPATVRLVEG